jgi:lactose/L-arabinose transport system permease protein
MLSAQFKLRRCIALKQAQAGATGRSKPFQLKVSKEMAPYVLLSPFLIVFIVFMIIPIINALYISFTSSQGSTSSWVGFENFKNVLTDELFWRSMGNTAIIMIVQIPIMLILAVLTAVALNAAYLRARGLWRLIIFLPVLIDLVTYSIVFSLIFNDQYGVINYILQAFHMDPIHWLEDSFWAKVTIIIALIWRWTGYNAIILLSALQGIDKSLYESAEVDGAGKITQFFKITVPMLKPILLFCTILSTIGTLQLFTEPFLLTNGGPNNATETPVMYIYQYGFQSFRFGYASASAYILTFIVGAFSYLQIRFTKGGEI